MDMTPLNEDFFDILINLDTFSRLPANTDIHLSQNGYFVANGGKYSMMMGAQTLSNLLNNYTPAQMLSDLDTYFTRVNKIVEQLYFNNMDHKIILLYQYMQFAYGDDNVGLCALLKTYQNHFIYQSFFESVYQVKDTMDHYYALAKLSKHNACPAANFTNEDWRLFMFVSQKLQYETTSLYKYYIKYSCNLLYNQLLTEMGVYQWYHLVHTVIQRNKDCKDIVTETGIYLGAMPIKTALKDDLKDLQNLGIEAVLSVVECFENQSEGLLTQPIGPKDWKQYGILYLQVPICDFQDIDLNKLQICVEFIHWIIKQHKHIYISCRAGKQRSTTVLIAYLIKYQGYTANEAYEYIKSKRPQIKNDHAMLLEKYEKLVKK